jgi:hypothetical protein
MRRSWPAIATPYISLTRARELHRIELKFGHLGRIKKHQERLAREEARHQLRERLFGVREEGRRGAT